MRPEVHPADTLYSPNPPALEAYGRRLLAEGDSWFTLGTFNVSRSSNLLLKLSFAGSVGIVNCARPGDTLQHMVDLFQDPFFDKLLRQPNHARYWEALLISGGGNDLIDAAQVAPTNAQGQPVPIGRRLLLTPAEAAAQGPLDEADSWISAPGWALLAQYLARNMAELVQRRDAGPSAGRPIFLHTYAVPTVRPAGTVGAPQGWLYPAVLATGVAQAMWQPVAARLFERLRQLLCSFDAASGSPLACPAVHVFDSAGLPNLTPAQPGTSGPSGDWVNEIHLTAAGYAKIGQPFGRFIDTVLATYPGPAA